MCIDSDMTRQFGKPTYSLLTGFLAALSETPFIKNLMQVCAPCRPNLGNPPASPLPEMRHSLYLNWPTLWTKRGFNEIKTTQQLGTGSNLLTPGGQDNKVVHNGTQIFDQVPRAPKVTDLVLLQDTSNLGPWIQTRFQTAVCVFIIGFGTRILFRYVLSELQCTLPLT